MQPSIPNIWGLEPVAPPTRKPIQTSTPETSLDLTELLNSLRSPSAIRGYGTTAGSIAGGLVGQPILGGIAGNALTNLAQSYFPETLGPASPNPIETALVDSLVNYGGGKVAEGILKVGEPLKLLRNKILGKPDNSIVAYLASKWGTKPSERKVVSALNPTYNTDLESSVKQLIQEKAPLSLGEITGKEGTKEFGLLAGGAGDRIVDQNVWLQKKAGELLGSKLGAVQRQNLLRYGPDNTTEWIVNSNPILRVMPGGPELVKNATKDLGLFEKLAQVAGPEKAHIALFKDALESSLDEGVWDAGKLFSYFTKNRDFFNRSAQLLEAKGVAKASDLKASWNRFIHANSLMQSSRSTSRRGMEMALTNAGISAAVGIPILGPLSYPAWRAAAGAGRILLVGPALGKAFNNPEVVEQFVKLTTNSANNPANTGIIKKLASWAWKNGIAWKSTEGVDFMINPNDLSKPYPVPEDQPMPQLIIPDNLWK